jgi:hypothetical protein
MITAAARRMAVRVSGQARGRAGPGSEKSRRAERRGAVGSRSGLTFGAAVRTLRPRRAWPSPGTACRRSRRWARRRSAGRRRSPAPRSGRLDRREVLGPLVELQREIHDQLAEDQARPRSSRRLDLDGAELLDGPAQGVVVDDRDLDLPLQQADREAPRPRRRRRRRPWRRRGPPRGWWWSRRTRPGRCGRWSSASSRAATGRAGSASRRACVGQVRGVKTFSPAAVAPSEPRRPGSAGRRR